MLARSLFTALCLVGSHQSAATAVTFGDVNIVAVTDVHAWIAGGDRQVPAATPTLDATFGDLVSFTERMRAAAALEGKDVFLVDNGDVVDGTGLSNAAADHCSYLLPLLRQVPFDALNCGNHELYDNATMEEFKSSGFIDSWGGKYLTSNLLNASTKQPLGARSTVLRGALSGVRVLTFGFMYDMGKDEGRCAAVGVDPVASVVSSDWFRAALRAEPFDAVLVLAHMDYREPLLRVILDGVRAVLPYAPVQFIAGHSHTRAQTCLDGRACVHEPGTSVAARPQPYRQQATCLIPVTHSKLLLCY
jgi:2',3'-cyclic-nucleotide 2'-phosphodiesterase (5'-nucleotidase family)